MYEMLIEQNDKLNVKKKIIIMQSSNSLINYQYQSLKLSQ